MTQFTPRDTIHKRTVDKAASHLLPTDGSEEFLYLQGRVAEVDHGDDVALTHVQAVLHVEQIFVRGLQDVKGVVQYLRGTANQKALLRSCDNCDSCDNAMWQIHVKIHRPYKIQISQPQLGVIQNPLIKKHSISTF